MNWVTKKTIFISSIGCLLFFLLMMFLYENNLVCGEWWECYDAMVITAYISLAVIFLLLPAYITFLISGFVFERWKKFATWAVPSVLAISLVFAIGEGPGGSGVGVLTLDARPFLLAILYGWFFIHSLVIIISATIRERRSRGE